MRAGAVALAVALAVAIMVGPAGDLADYEQNTCR